MTLTSRIETAETHMTHLHTPRGRKRDERDHTQDIRR